MDISMSVVESIYGVVHSSEKGLLWGDRIGNLSPAANFFYKSNPKEMTFLSKFSYFHHNSIKVYLSSKIKIVSEFEVEKLSLNLFIIKANPILVN